MTGASPSDRPVLSVALAVVLALAGLSIAIVAGASPTYHVALLPASGSFFALASSGDTLYAASDNAGSILIERSVDRGASWTSNPVPYSAVAGGAPWEHAAIAVGGRELLLVASASTTTDVYVPYGYGPACSSNSTVLIASSPDQGSTWVTRTLTEAGLGVSSIQASLMDPLGAVAWSGPTDPCSSSAVRVAGVASHDGGTTWSAEETLTAPGDASTGGALEMTTTSDGILAALEVVPSTTSSYELHLWELATANGSSFAPFASLPAPSSWTLQGDAGIPAILLTPTYLVPLRSAPYTAIPFNELATDGGSIGALPRVVSVIPAGPTAVEIAATTADELGVDCWRIDTTSDVVTRSCHVDLNADLAPPTTNLPIVALLDGGGWWAAIGASGDGCSVGCVPGCLGPCGPVPVGAPSAGSSAGASVGTSVCRIGCASFDGLVAYTYDPGAAGLGPIAPVVAAGVTALGLAVLTVERIRSRRPRIDRPTSSPDVPPSPEEVARDGLVRRYRRGLAVWVILWTPIALVPFVAGSAEASTAAALLIVVLGLTGIVVGDLYHGRVRKALLETEGSSFERLLETATTGGPEAPVSRIATTSALSWALAAVSVAALGVWGFGGPLTPVVAAPLVALGVVRAIHHWELARGVQRSAGIPARGGTDPARERWTPLRTALGAGLLPWNPLLGLLLGWVALPTLGASPYLLAWALLPVTLAGAALLAGTFGPTNWVPTARPGPAAVPS